MKRRIVIKTFDPQNYSKKGIMAGVVYGDGTHKIKKQKVVTVTTPRKTKVKTVDYGPIDYYGKQTKTKTKIVKRR
jgi:hypothetical protein